MHLKTPKGIDYILSIGRFPNNTNLKSSIPKDAFFLCEFHIRMNLILVYIVVSYNLPSGRVNLFA